MTFGLSRRVLFVLALSLGGLATGCGGGTSGPPATPPLANSHGNASAQVSVKIPPKSTTSSTSRTPAYISPATQSIGIVVTPNGGSPFPVVIADVPGVDCTGDAQTGYSCTITVLAQAGANTLTITTYSGLDGGGSVLSTGTINESFTAGQSPSTIPITLSGVISSVVMSITHNDINGVPEVDQNVPVGQTATLTLTAEDASGNVIMGTYATPITITGPASGLSYITSFASSSQSSTTITWQNAPYYYGDPIDEVDFKAFQGSTQVGSIQLNPTSTVLTFPAGDGTATDDQLSYGLTASNGSLYYTTFGDDSDVLPSQADSEGGNIGVVNVAAETQTISSALSYQPYGVYVDPTDQGVWVANSYDEKAEEGSLMCYPSVSNVANPSEYPLPVPSTGEDATPVAMVSDYSGNLWYVDSYNSVLGYAPMTTSQCGLTQTAFTTFRSPAGDSYYTSIAFDGSNVWTNDESNGDAWYANDNDDGVISERLPGASTIGAVASDSQGNIDVAGIGGTYGDYSTILAEVPSGMTSFGDTMTLPNIAPDDIAVAGTGANKLYALAAVSNGGIGYLAVSNPSNGVYLAAPNAAQDVGCTMVAFDNANMPWSICSDGTYAHLERFIITDAAWNLFLDTSDVGEKDEYSTIAGIGGGAAGTTFTVVCSSTLTCTQSTPGGRTFTVYANEPGGASVQVTGSDGRVVTQNFTVTINEEAQSVGRRLAQSVRGRRLLGSRLTARLLRN